MRKLITALLLVALFGCVAPPTAVTTSQRVKVTHDPFQKFTAWEGPDFRFDGSSVSLRAREVDGRPDLRVFQIYVVANYSGDWRFYEQVFDAEGTRLSASNLSRKVNSCSGGTCRFTEHVGVIVSREYLEKIKTTGVTFKIVGKAGSQVVNLPAEYVIGFMEVAGK